MITSRLRTLRDHIRWAVSRFHGEDLFFGHGTDNAWDEARQLVLGALHLPWEIADSYLDCNLEEEEISHVQRLLHRRIHERVPTAYLLNEAWSHNWGYVPLTESEIAYAGKKLKPIIYDELVRVAEYDGKPVAFMLTLPDINELIRDLNGELFPFGWAKLLWRLRKPKVRRIRVPLQGVVKSLQGTRLASIMGFQMIEYICATAVEQYGAKRGEIGWILEDNGPMRSIADVIEAFSRYMPFEAGDLIAMGAPKGVALGKPNAAELYLKPGDHMEIGFEGLMSLRTRIVAPNHEAAS